MIPVKGKWFLFYELSSVSWLGKFPQEGGWGEGRNRAFGAGEQMVIAGDDPFGAAGHGAPDEFVIGRVSRYETGTFWSGNRLEPGKYFVHEQMIDFLASQPEFGIGEYPQIFGHDIRRHQRGDGAVFPEVDKTAGYSTEKQG
jgi:hypothetical protein